MAKQIAFTQQSSPKEESIGSPYLVARREWDERYGGLIKRAQQWRAAAVLALLVALAEAIVIIGVATRPTNCSVCGRRRFSRARGRGGRHRSDFSH